MGWDPSVEHLENLVHAHLKYRSHVISKGHIKPGEPLPTTSPPPKTVAEKKPTHTGWCFTCGKKVNAETKGERHNKNDTKSVYGPCENCGQTIHQMVGKAAKANGKGTSTKK